MFSALLLLVFAFLIAQQSLDCGTPAPLWISVRYRWKVYRIQEAIKTG